MDKGNSISLEKMESILNIVSKALMYLAQQPQNSTDRRQFAVGCLTDKRLSSENHCSLGNSSVEEDQRRLRNINLNQKIC